MHPVQCDCGRSKLVFIGSLRGGRTTSCGICGRFGQARDRQGRGPRDLTGQRFGRLLVVGSPEVRQERNGHGRAYHPVRCDCGRETAVQGNNLISGHTRSCGCLHQENVERIAAERKKPPVEKATHVTYLRERNGKTKIVTQRINAHGQSKTRLHRKWKSMVERCHNPDRHNYRWYGARGIRVCKEWRQDFVTFADWARTNGYVDGLELDRVDNERGYSPDNCRWVAKHDNLANRRAYLPERLEDALQARAERDGVPAYLVVRRAVAAYLGIGEADEEVESLSAR